MFVSIPLLICMDTINLNEYSKITQIIIKPTCSLQYKNIRNSDIIMYQVT